MKICVIICQSTCYEKYQKMPFFRTSAPFVRKVPLYLGSEFEYYLTKGTGAISPIRHNEPFQNMEDEDAR